MVYDKVKPDVVLDSTLENFAFQVLDLHNVSIHILMKLPILEPKKMKEKNINKNYDEKPFYEYI